tara:strand:- start:88 stop:402 length:315 start_codon:yes stop_codon:yes gene_type:complete
VICAKLYYTNQEEVRVSIEKYYNESIKWQYKESMGLPQHSSELTPEQQSFVEEAGNFKSLATNERIEDIIYMIEEVKTQMSDVHTEFLKIRRTLEDIRENDVDK